MCYTDYDYEVLSADIRQRRSVKRESGENPERSGHCKQGGKP